jgi:hypothetical protein
MTPQQFDVLCANYDEARTLAERLDKTLSEAKAQVMNAVLEHGRVPTNAEASRRFEGQIWSGTVTTSTTIEILDDNVTALELALSKAKLPRVFQQMFSRRVEYTMLKDAEKVLPQTRLPKRYAARIKQLYGRCFVPRKKTPSLKVESVVDARAREEKAAKKAAKKGGAK